MEEIWKDHPHHDFLSVSSLGRVKIKPFTAITNNGGVRLFIGKPYSGYREKDGRMVFINRKRKFKKRIHILVCETFHGEKPFPSAVVMHLDDNPSNNRADNLQWGSQKDNLNTESFIAYCKSRVGDDNPRIKGMQKFI